MKKLLSAVSAAAIFSFGTAAMAWEDITVQVIDSGIIQVQHGHDLHQDATIGIVTQKFAKLGRSAFVNVKGSLILQAQHGHHISQTARIGVVGCDCTEAHIYGKGKHGKGGKGGKGGGNY